MQILGVDPGLGITGYGLIESRGNKFRILEAGIIRTKAAQSLPQRLKAIADGLTELMKEYSPKVLVLEKLYSHYRHPTTAILMGHVRGVACFAAEEMKVPVVGYSKTRVNKGVIGKGHATKEQVSMMVQMLLGLDSAPRPLDVSDALALALCHARITRSIKL